MLAALYAFCVLMPSVAVAVTRLAAHCLTDDRAAHVHQRVAQSTTAHAHADGAHSHTAKAAAHDYADPGAPRDHATGDGKSGANCCGLFCVSAIAQKSPGFSATPVVSAETVSALADVLTGRGPDRLIRPPIG